MKATVTVAFDGVPDGAIYPRTFAPGDTVEGDLARVAVREGWATIETAEATTAAPTPRRMTGRRGG